ncbi:MAG: cyanophycinase [Acidobacteriota bacterium]|nr:cyanophycinase [Acidobacteriota bacterium]
MKLPVAGALLLGLSLAQSPAPSAPGFTHAIAGNPGDAKGRGQGGYVLAGGGTDQEAAFKWLIERSGGGDIVVIRASGADAYNKWILDLGGADSVETIIFTDRSAASDPFVIERLRRAEAVFIAGGDQSRYVNYWKGTPVEDELHALLERGGPIGGTSAGLAILGEFGFGAREGGLTSREALPDPFVKAIELDRDFLSLPHLERLITDTHFVERDRLGRLLTFLARIQKDGWSATPRALAVDRETAVLVDPSGRATLAGKNTAYFIRPTRAPDVCEPGKPLTMRGIEVYRITASGTFDLPAWRGTGGLAYSLDVVNGVVTSSRGDLY